MTNYIILKRKTVRRIAAMTVFLIVAAVAAIVVVPMLKKKPVATIEAASRNTLIADGHEMAYFSGMSNDTILTGLSTDKDSVRWAQLVRTNPQMLKSAIRRTTALLKRRIDAMEDARKEMDYYMGVHGVQDEGYDMVANHDQTVKGEIEKLKSLTAVLDSASNATSLNILHTAVNVHPKAFKPTAVAVDCFGGRWSFGRWSKTKLTGKVVTNDYKGRIVCAVSNADTIVSGRRTDSLGTYNGQMNRWAMAYGHGHHNANDGTFYEGAWADNKRNGFGFAVSRHKLRAGEWKDDVYKGERMQYTSERIYGIDISKYQHGKGRKRYPIQWSKLRIVNLGKVGNRNAKGAVGYPVSFVYIKSTEGTSVRNPYFKTDYKQAHKYGFKTGAYHFFSVRSTATAQANYFLRHSSFRRGDMPPVLDVEPTDAQIQQIGGAAALFSQIRTWMSIVGNRTGVKPILYVSQRFVNKYLSQAPDIKRKYNVWIARYGEYKPDVKLVYWQLCADGRVSGIQGDVDINVFNGYEDKFKEFVSTETVK